MKKYDTLRQHRNGLGVVNVLGGVCQGCFMAIPPQQYNLLLRGDQHFDCPTCQRIMYHEPVEVPEEPKKAPKKAAKKKAVKKTAVKKKAAKKTVKKK